MTGSGVVIREVAAACYFEITGVTKPDSASGFVRGNVQSACPTELGS